jgi:cytochrome c biogenesis protein CcmG/thiol:disulfide interchange protein DsbE
MGGVFSMIGKLATSVVCVTACVAALSLVACGGSSDSGRTARAPDYQAALAGAPRPLAKLYGAGDRLLTGGTDAFQAQLDALRGYPVVVNKWASWCEPCRREFPYLQRLSARYGKRVAFLGVDAKDSAAAARTFLREFPLPYPSFSDPDQDISGLLGATAGFPATAYYDSNGERVFVKQGQYASRADFAADIRRYATPDPGHRGGGR